MQRIVYVLICLIAFGVTYAVARSRQLKVAETAKEQSVAPEKISALVTVDGMVLIKGGEFDFGTNSELGWPDEKPLHRAHVDSFWIDKYEVTNAQFREFVKATGYVTTAEKAPSLGEIMSQVPAGTPPPSPDLLVAGSLVFTPPDHEVSLDDIRNWWQWVPGANWQHPEGPESNLDGRENHPVVQVSWDDASAYAKWANKRLPTEAEWEFASRGGLVNKDFTWGDDPPNGQQSKANVWQGTFPNLNTKADGYVRTAPVGTFEANGYGLHDMAGNVWEWCSDWYDRDLHTRLAKDDRVVNPAGPSRTNDRTQPFAQLRVQKGGSFLCNESYCLRYRPSARHGGAPDTGMSHLGFRCAQDVTDK